MRVLIALDSFKDSLSSAAACQAVARGFDKAGFSSKILPISDGGEGFLACIKGQKEGSILHEIPCLDAYLKPQVASILLHEDSCYIECAQFIGLERVALNDRRVQDASSHPLSLALKEGKRLGAKRFVIGLGGSATNDLGAGFLQGLGAVFYGEQGEIKSPICGKDLLNIKSIDLGRMQRDFGEVYLACDVENPLTGPNGASHIYARQKGANDGDIELLERGIMHLEQLLNAAFGKSPGQEPGSGAAGGLGAAFFYAFDAKKCAALDILGAAEALEDVDLLITGEGRVDKSTIKGGKAPLALARLAKAKKVPAIALCGSLELDLAGLCELEREGLGAAFSIVSGPMELAQALHRALDLLELSAFNLARSLRLLG